MDAVRASGLLNSLVTIQTPPESDSFDAGGAMNPNTPWTDLPDHVNLACMASPLETGENVVPAEIRSESEIIAKLTRHVFIAAFLPLIRADYRAVIDGVSYNITKSESDSQSKQTRLAVEMVTI